MLADGEGLRDDEARTQVNKIDPRLSGFNWPARFVSLRGSVFGQRRVNSYLNKLLHVPHVLQEDNFTVDDFEFPTLFGVMTGALAYTKLKMPAYFPPDTAEKDSPFTEPAGIVEYGGRSIEDDV